MSGKTETVHNPIETSETSAATVVDAIVSETLKAEKTVKAALSAYLKKPNAAGKSALVAAADSYKVAWLAEFDSE